MKVVPLFYQTWVKIADGHSEDPTCPDVYEHIVSTLTARDTRVVWMFAEWALQKNQEVNRLHCTALPSNRQQRAELLNKKCSKLPTKPKQFIECIMSTVIQVFGSGVCHPLTQLTIQYFCEKVGVQIFTKRDHDHNTFKAEEILTFLKDYPQASLLYLEFLIDHKSEVGQEYQ